jgi:Tol biopolymer transport system component
MIGKSLGPYKIVEAIGAGGMGEVYLAEDTRLNRQVAVKVLPAEFASDPDRLARFEQEARAAAGLNHPHIAAIHDVGVEDGTHFMVQEYLQGHTLREPLKKGALPLKTALQIATEIAEGLTAAHAAGIIHRDLKPENIFITREGHAKILDFGLAKLTEPSDLIGSDPAESPTMTVAGQVMGTAGYLAPEQAEGSADIDHRADVFAFGCVLYEMLSGKQPFTGRSVAETISRIQHDEPSSLAEVDAALPMEVHRIDKKCLAKDPANRYQTPSDLVVDLKSLVAEVEAGASVSLATRPDATGSGTGRTGLWRHVAAGLALASVTGWIMFYVASTRPGPYRELGFVLPQGQRVATDMDVRLFDIDRMGEKIAWVTQEEPRQIYVRYLDSQEVRLVKNTEGADNASVEFSPDGEWVAFVKDGDLVAVPLDGEGPERAIQPGTGTEIWDFDWAEDESWYITLAYKGLYRLDPTGTMHTLREVTREMRMGYVRALPGGQAVIFGGWSTEEPNRNHLYVMRLDGSEPRRLLDDVTFAVYFRGYLLFGDREAIYAASFDLSTHDIGTRQQVVPKVEMDNDRRIGEFAVSETGTLVYLPEQGLREWGLAQIELGDVPPGEPDFLEVERDNYILPGFNPSAENGEFVVAVRGGGVRTSNIRLALGNLGSPGHDWISPADGEVWNPVWRFDGRVIAFEGVPTGTIWQMPPGGVQGELYIGTDTTPIVPLSYSPDGRALLAAERLPLDEFQMVVLDLEQDPPFRHPVSQNGTKEHFGVFSPNGKWVATVSDEEGEAEVFVRSYSAEDFSLGSGRRVSREGGWYPVWNGDDEILYLDKHAQMLKSVQFVDGVPRRPTDRIDLSDLEIPQPLWIMTGRPYDVSPSGKLLIVAREKNRRKMEVNVTFNWSQELERIMRQ